MTKELRGRANRHRTGAFTVGRRAFLAGTGGVVLALPFLEAIHGRVGAAPRTPTRFIVWHQGQGTQFDQWAIRGSSDTDFTFGRILEPLADLRDRFVFFHGLDNKSKETTEGDGHTSSYRSLLCGTPNQGGPSIDAEVFNRIRLAGHRAPMHAAIGSSARTGRFLAGAGDAVDSINSPRMLLDSFFMGVTDPGGEVPMEDPAAVELARLRARRGRALDAVIDSFASFRRRLGTDDRERLDLHASRLAELEARFASMEAMPPPTAGATCARPTIGEDYDPAGDWIRATDDISELVAMAFACNVTPVATVEWTLDHDPAIFAPYLGGYSDWHSMVHAGESMRGLTGLHESYRWYAERMGTLLRRLAATSDGEGSLLDSTLVLWSSDFGYGAGHNGLSTQLTLAGSLGPSTPMGRVMSFVDPEEVYTSSRYTQANLFTSILHAFGQTDEHFGLRSGEIGPIPGLLG